jgi:hypothetical protein
MGLAGVVPIILNCYVGHQSVHGIMGMLKPYSAGEDMNMNTTGETLLQTVSFQPCCTHVLPNTTGPNRVHIHTTQPETAYRCKLCG